MDLDKLLCNIQKPARYIGNELNSIRKAWEACEVKICISYPDVYEIGMSYTGLQILYHLINEKSDMLCERVFAPWPDMESALRENETHLFSLESRKPLKDFDVIGFSLGYELTYTNVLNILDLGGVRVFSKDRKAEDPIIIAGGTCAANPNPMADFVDIFFIGDGEESLPEFLELLKDLKRKKASRGDIIYRSSSIKGLYVPLIHTGNCSIDKRVVVNLDKSFYPTNPIVPFIKTVHDRVAIEIMRGCPNNCSFCQAKAYYHPVRMRSKNRVLDLTTASLENTGYEEVSFLSLSSSDYPYLIDIIDAVGRKFSEKGVNVSVPSLRTEKIRKSLPERIARNRKTGLTFAPEAGTANLREKINKRIDMNTLNAACISAFRSGWRRIKLYFMIGLPGETEDDLCEIIALAKEISLQKKKIDGKRANVTLSINSFIPKPHTALQWLGMEKLDVLMSKQKKLLSIANDRYIKINFHDAKMNILEAALSRGDRSLCPIIYQVWKKGVKFDAWREFFDISVWERVFEENGISLYEYAQKNYKISNILPWGFINTGIPVEVLRKEAMRIGIS